MVIPRGHLQLERMVKDDGVLQFHADGSALATNKKAFIAVEGISQQRREAVPLAERELGAGAVSVTAETARSVLKLIPRDKMFQGALEHADIRREGDTELSVVTTDGKRVNRVRARCGVGRIDPAPVMREIDGAARSGQTVCLNRKRLLMLLDTMERAAEDSSGESPVWLSITEGGDVALRGINQRTGQRVIGYMHAYRDVPELERSPWEMKYGRRPRRRRRRR